MCLPGHAAVYSKVERVGQTDEGVDHQHNVLGNVVVHEGEPTAKESLGQNTKKILRRPILSFHFFSSNITQSKVHGTI